MVMLINRRIGTLRLDAVISETHKSELKITENPVESGANIADHAYVQPATWSSRASWSSTTTRWPVCPSTACRGTQWQRVSRQRPAWPALAPHPQGESRAKRELKSWLEPLADATKARPLAPWMLESQPLSRFDSSPSQSRLQQIYQCLLDTQKAGELLQVQTGFYLYKNMLLSTIAATQTLDGAIELDLTLREVLVVETRVINGVVTPAAGTERSGRSEKQGAAKKPQGKTTPKADARNESFCTR